MSKQEDGIGPKDPDTQKEKNLKKVSILTSGFFLIMIIRFVFNLSWYPTFLIALFICSILMIIRGIKLMLEKGACAICRGEVGFFQKKEIGNNVNICVPCLEAAGMISGINYKTVTLEEVENRIVKNNKLSPQISASLNVETIKKRIVEDEETKQKRFQETQEKVKYILENIENTENIGNPSKSILIVLEKYEALITTRYITQELDESCPIPFGAPDSLRLTIKNMNTGSESILMKEIKSLFEEIKIDDLNFSPGSLEVVLLNGIREKILQNTPETNLLPYPGLQMRKKSCEIAGEFKPTHQLGVIGFDDNAKKWATYNKKGYVTNILSYEDIVSYELLEDGESLVKGGLGVKRAVVGGLLFGAAGAILGGLTKKKETEKICTSLQLRITISNINNPSVVINFINTATVKTSESYKLELEKARNCLSILDVICQKDDNQNTDSILSTADEIKKYKELLDAKAITREEFDEKKKELLRL